MEKIAVLVLGASAPKILDRTLSYLEDPRFKIFLHLDAKTDFSWYSSFISRLDRLNLVDPRIAVYWGGFTMIKAELALLQHALADPEIGFFVLISDDAVPVRGPEQIYQSLRLMPDRMGAEQSAQVQSWYDRFFFPDSRFTSMRQMDVNLRHVGPMDWESLRHLKACYDRGKKPLSVSFGRQWWSLGRETASSILQRVAEDDHLVTSFQYSLFPDETFFPTLFRLCFPDMTVPDVPMFADYSQFPVPWTYGGTWELSNVKLQPEHLFLRKITPEGTNIVDEIATWHAT